MRAEGCQTISKALTEAVAFARQSPEPALESLFEDPWV